MGDSTLDSELFILFNRWGSSPRLYGNCPPGGFTDARHHNVANPVYELGTCVQVYNRSSKAGKDGPSQLIYLKVGTQNADSVIAVKSAVIQDSATVPYTITNDPDSCIKLPTGTGAFALGAMTDAYYGWFWCGGVCPEEFISTMAGNFATDSTVAAGQICYHDLAADYAGIAIADTAGEDICGFALAADA